MATSTKNRPAPSKQTPARQPQRPAQQSQSREVATRKSTEVSTDVLERAAQMAGHGVSDRQEDNIVPLIYLLQVNSPQAMKGHAKYIKGAEGGDIWLRNLPDDQAIVQGGEDGGILFQPCHHIVSWIEWMPDRGGFVARHDSRPEAAEQQDVETDSGTKKAWVMPNGNTVVQTREFPGYVIREDGEALPYTLSMSSTGHTIGKQWNTQMRAEKLPGTDVRAPAFYYFYRIGTKLTTRNDQSWYQYVITKDRAVETVDELNRGEELYKAFQSGLKRSATGGEDEVDGEIPVDEK